MTDESLTGATTVIMETLAEKSSIGKKSVSFLGPVSSYTHQVYTLSQHDRPAWSIGLTDWDWAKTALQCFDEDQYDFRPATTITGEDT